MEEPVHRGGAQGGAQVHSCQPPADLLPHLRMLRQQQPQALAAVLVNDLYAATRTRCDGRQLKQWLAWVDANPADPAEVHGWDEGEFDDPPAAA